jgi:hypothetical protein
MNELKDLIDVGVTIRMVSEDGLITEKYVASEDLTMDKMEKYCSLPKEEKLYKMLVFCVGYEEIEKVFLVFGSTDMNPMAITRAIPQYLMGDEIAYLDGELDNVGSSNIVNTMESALIHYMAPVGALFWDGNNLGGKA